MGGIYMWLSLFQIFYLRLFWLSARGARAPCNEGVIGRALFIRWEWHERRETNELLRSVSGSANRVKTKQGIRKVARRPVLDLSIDMPENPEGGFVQNVLNVENCTRNQDFDKRRGYPNKSIWLANCRRREGVEKNVIGALPLWRSFFPSLVFWLAMPHYLLYWNCIRDKSSWLYVRITLKIWIWLPLKHAHFL